MSDFREMVFKKAFQVIPGIDYNKTLEEVYKNVHDSNRKPFFYELVLPETGNWEQFRDKTYPLFVRYMKTKRIDPEDPRGIVVTIFFKDFCYFLEGAQFVSILCEMDHLSPEALHFKVMGWLRE